MALENGIDVSSVVDSLCRKSLYLDGRLDGAISDKRTELSLVCSRCYCAILDLELYWVGCRPVTV